jgi:hypothetical protein
LHSLSLLLSFLLSIFHSGGFAVAPATSIQDVRGASGAVHGVRPLDYTPPTDGPVHGIRPLASIPPTD